MEKSKNAELRNLQSEDWSKLLDQSQIDEARREGEKRFEHLTSEDFYSLRRMAKTDLFFLTEAILGYHRLTPRLHGNLCAWMERTQYEQFRMVLLPRSHFKTTVGTIADSIQTSLTCDKGVGAAYPRDLGPEVRILLGHETQGPPGGSSRFLYEITSHFISNPKVMGLFPELVPQAREQRMNTFELQLPRKAHWAEPTFDTIGVGGHGQGRHYNLFKLDDIFGDKARDSKAERERTIQWFDNIQSFLVRIMMDHMDIFGTRYSLDDVYQHAMKVYGPKMIKYIRRVLEVNEESKQLEPIFPEEFSIEALSVIRKNLKVWSAQYANDPHEGLAEFNPNWKRYYYWSGQGKISAFHASQTVPNTYHVRDLDRVILCDPSVSRSPGIVVVGTDDRFRHYTLETVKEVMGPEKLVDRLFKLVQKWNPRCVSIEEVVFSAVYKPWIEREMVIRNQRFAIIPYKPPKSKMKIERVKALAMNFSSGQILFHEGQADIIEEYDNFGTTENYHLLDALAQIIEVGRHGGQARAYEERRKLEEQLLNDRDVLTGYSMR